MPKSSSLNFCRILELIILLKSQYNIEDPLAKAESIKKFQDSYSIIWKFGRLKESTASCHRAPQSLTSRTPRYRYANKLLSSKLFFRVPFWTPRDNRLCCDEENDARRASRFHRNHRARKFMHADTPRSWR